MATDITNIPFVSLTDETHTLANYTGQVILIVNTASKCGFTPQLKALDVLYQRYREQGFTVIGFPCNQFGKQEPQQGAALCSLYANHHQVTFPMMAKIDVNGLNTHPLYHALKQAAPGLGGTKRIKWNFTKFLINKKSQVNARFAPITKPEKLEQAIVSALNES